jgi:hypothetical protein
MDIESCSRKEREKNSSEERGPTRGAIDSINLGMAWGRSTSLCDVATGQGSIVGASDMWQPGGK